MKKILILFSFLSFVVAFSQCVINGNSTMRVSETQTFTVDNDIAQCVDCHLWVNIDGNASIVGDPRKNSVKIKANSGGRALLSLTMLSSQGVVQCSKNIDIVSDASTTVLKNEENKISSNCDINFNDYKELKYANGIVTFLPDKLENNYKFDWTATYANGDQKKSSEKVPQFNYSAENGITTVVLKLTSAKCIRNFTKSYEASYWKFF